MQLQDNSHRTPGQIAASYHAEKHLKILEVISAMYNASRRMNKLLRRPCLGKTRGW